MGCINFFRECLPLFFLVSPSSSINGGTRALMPSGSNPSHVLRPPSLCSPRHYPLPPRPPFPPLRRRHLLLLPLRRRSRSLLHAFLSFHCNHPRSLLSWSGFALFDDFLLFFRRLLPLWMCFGRWCRRILISGAWKWIADGLMIRRLGFSLGLLSMSFVFTIARDWVGSCCLKLAPSAAILGSHWFYNFNYVNISDYFHCLSPLLFLR